MKRLHVQAYYELAYFPPPGRTNIASKPRPERSVGFLITDVSHLLRRNFNRRAQALGLTQAQWRALAHLARSEGLNQAALAERIEIQPITLTRLIDRMEASGWVERRADPEDRRAIRLYLTPKAEPVLVEMQRAAGALLELALAGLSADERKDLADTLCKVKENLSEAEGAAAAAGTGTRMTTHGRDARTKRTR